MEIRAPCNNAWMFMRYWTLLWLLSAPPNLIPQIKNTAKFQYFLFIETIYFPLSMIMFYSFISLLHACSWRAASEHMFAKLFACIDALALPLLLLFTGP